MTDACERHEQRLAAQLRVLKAKDAYTRISVGYLMGKVPSVEHVRAALDEVQAARSNLAPLDA